MNSKRSVRRSRLIVVVLLLIAVCAVCGPHITATARATKGAGGYGEVVKLVETHYRVKHRGIPTGVNLGVKAAKIASSDVRRVLRFGNLKLAIFEDQDFTSGVAGAFYAALRSTLEPQWQSLLAVRVRDEAQTYTFTREDAGKFKVLIAVIAPRDATVLEVELNEAEFAKLVFNPEQESRALTDEATSEEPE